MSLTQTDKLMIMSALWAKIEKCKEMIEKHPENEFWTERLEQVENAKKNFGSMS